MPARVPAPASGAARTALTRRRILTGAFGLTAAGLWSPPAYAAPATGPVIFDCGAWGARPPSEPVEVLAAPPRRIIVHHTATRNVEDYSQQRAFALARAIQNYHMDVQGWIDTGQHFTVSRGAFVTEGRHRSFTELTAGGCQVRSAHCVGQNDVAVGIENEGTYTTEEPPARQYEALVSLCAHVCATYGLPPSEIRGHRDFNDTECPGERLYALLPKLRQDVAQRLGVQPWPEPEPETPEERHPWPGPPEYLPPEALARELAHWTPRR
ncbi:peptidoglycan recognition protein family protein [Streptomyces sp. NBC_00249]|uniref:peptidoglycan recognition protein family protein n=1 Tax=Streptomyces sp. NBC_00249 TaxID=2975690 RepID=UPI002259E688|nr:peptidoglycan recognition family protein [Streptomyces sp. NBC_00249]MCX5195500.1 peptidoglycan recognition protein family protein [Streptomyces sp. NBC_00249]